jgi:hypothetical protein
MDALTGIAVDVQSAETALDDVLRVVKELIPITVTTKGPDLHYREGAIAKYGILDVTFGIGSTSLEIRRPGLGILRSLALVDGGTESADVTDGFLGDLISESEAGTLYLKVFLETEARLSARDALDRLRQGMSPGFWPNRFVVKDACLTGAPSIWLAKHFYM